MKLKKTVSILCIMAMFLSIVVAPDVYADTNEDNESVTKTVMYVNDDFENGDLSDWYFRADEATGTKNASVVTENGNKFLRVSYTGLHSDGNGKVVAYSKKFSDGKFMRDMDNCTVFEMKMRTNSNKLRKYIKYNYPTSGTIDTNGFGEIGYNTRVAAAMASGNFRATYAQVGGTDPKTFMQGNLEHLTSYELDKWYRFKTVYNNKNYKANTYIYNQNGVLVDSYTNKTLDAWWFNYYDYNKQQEKLMDSFEDVTIHFLYAENVTDEQFDLDDLRIFNQKAQVEAKVAPNTDVGIIYNPEELSLVFDAPVKVSENAITVVDYTGTPVTHNGNYNEDTFTYTATFEQALPEGEYKFVIDPSKAVPVNETVGMIQQMRLKETEISFTSFATMPPVADNVRIQGRVIPNTKISADYDFISTAAEGTSLYEWYMCSSANGEFTKIENEASKEITVTEQMYGNYIKFKVKPITSAGLEGTQYYESNVLVPEKAPEVSNITLSSDLFAKGTTIVVSYDFYDENLDSDVATEIDWYVSDNGTDGWSLVQSGERFEIRDEYDGKYFKCKILPVSEGSYENTGLSEESEVYGPVGDLIVLTNLIKNGDFEGGNLDHWVDEGIAIEITDNAYDGNYAMRTHKRTTASQNFHQDINLEAEKTYIVSAMVKSANMKTYSGYEAYNWKGTVTKLDRDNEMTEITDEWKRVTLSFSTPTAGEYAFGFMSFAKFDAETIIDNVYLGELIISDIETYKLNTITVPQGEEVVKIPVVTGKIFNQFSETDGLTGQNVVVSVPDLPGVSVKDNIIVVDSSANSGTVEVSVSCRPSYKGAAQSEFIKKLEFEILPHNDVTPKALSVSASGDVITGNTLTGAYKFYQVEGKAEASELIWMYSDSENGEYKVIPGATGTTYTVESTYSDKFIKFAVLPKTNDGLVGEEVRSNALVKPTAPVASDVYISGDFKIGGKVTGQYEFNDANKDNQAISTYKWYVSDTAEGVYTLIEGQNDNILQLTEDLVNKYIKFGVVPVADKAPYNGTEVLSNAYIGPSAPSVHNIAITNNGGRLVASYDFYHPYNARELESVYEWTVDGKVVSVGEASYTINFAGTKAVTFSVTPVGDTNPSTGTKVSKTVVITGSNGSAGGSSSGGGGGSFGGGGGSSSGSGGGITSGVISINGMNTETPKENSEPVKTPQSDIGGHWGESYIKTMEQRGVMTADENGKYNPDQIVTRKDMLTFLFKTLNLETTAYSGIFSDVSNDEFGGILQTMVDNGTISKDTTFRPDDSISREEMCKILYISLENAGKLGVIQEGAINNLADYNEISDWAIKYVNAMYSIKMMIGVSDDCFAPKENLTKAQAATLLTRIISLTEGE